MKKTPRLILFFVSVILLAACLSVSPGYPKFNSCIMDTEELIDSMSKLTLVQAQAPDIFFDGEKLFYDPYSHTYYYLSLIHI